MQSKTPFLLKLFLLMKTFLFRLQNFICHQTGGKFFYFLEASCSCIFISSHHIYNTSEAYNAVVHTAGLEMIKT
jgi:hypothetical protein